MAARTNSDERTAKRVLVVGSINVDLYHDTPGSIKLGGEPCDVTPVKGMTLPAASFKEKLGLTCETGAEEALVLSMDGPFEQKTGGKGANAAAAAGQSFACEFIGNLGAASHAENQLLLADLDKFGSVETARGAVLPDCPTGTAYILLFPDGDNAIVLLGGANQRWPPAEQLCAPGGKLSAALAEAVCVMLQREVPPHVNVAVAAAARQCGVPVVMDVGGTDAPIDPELMPHVGGHFCTGTRRVGLMAGGHPFVAGTSRSSPRTRPSSPSPPESRPETR